MSGEHQQLALGTAQFGLPYGVMGSGSSVPPSTARALLERAHALGIRTLDTAAAYGDIEQHLAALCGDLDFEIVSKIPAFPPGASSAERRAFVAASTASSLERLGSRLRALLFHDARSLTGDDAGTLWAVTAERVQRHGVLVGVSGYDPGEVEALTRRVPLEIVQLPGNALDQRLREIVMPRGVVLHLRSVFLQGVLLAPADEAGARLPAAAQALVAWRRWCAERALAPLNAALSVVKAFPGVSHVVVGVETLAQLEQIVAA